MSIALQESSSAPELPDQAALVPYRWMREFKSYYGLQKDFELKLHNCSTFSFCVKIPNELFCRRLSVSQLRNAVRQRTLYFLNLYSSSQCLFAMGGLCLGLLQRGHVHPFCFPLVPAPSDAGRGGTGASLDGTLRAGPWVLAWESRESETPGAMVMLQDWVFKTSVFFCDEAIYNLPPFPPAAKFL